MLIHSKTESYRKETKYHLFPKNKSILFISEVENDNGKLSVNNKLAFNSDYTFPNKNRYILNEHEIFRDNANRLTPVFSYKGGLREYVKTKSYYDLLNNYEFKSPAVGTQYTLNSKSSIVNEFELDGVLDQSIFDDHEIFFFSWYDHMLYDQQGLPVSRAVECDYIESVFSSRELRSLKKVLEHIKTHPWYVNSEETSIECIPYYNNDSGNDKYIKNLYLCPSDEEWAELVLKEKQNDAKNNYGKRVKNYVGHRNWKEYDPLGISQFVKEDDDDDD